MTSSPAPDPTPALRPEIEALPTRHEGKDLFVLYDRSGLSAAQLAVSPAFMFVAGELDGASSILDIQDRFARESGGAVLPAEELRRILEALDEALFLQSARFTARLEALRREFAEAPVRPAFSAGSAYPADPAELRRMLDGILESAPPAEEPDPARAEGRPAPRGAIAPHIDYPRGRDGYGQLYRELARREPPEIVVLLGTAHQSLANRFAVCAKDFAVPGGALPVARGAVARLLDECAHAADFSVDAFAHRGEHSIELQAVWLHRIWGDRISIVPVLCGSLADRIEKSDGEDPQLAAFGRALVNLVRSGPRVMLLASADLSHVGPRFGDERELSDAFLAETEEADRHYLAAVAAGDAAAGLASLARHGDLGRVCGAGCIHALNTALPGTRGRLLGYHQAGTPELGQAVSFASMLFE